ncbi:MAG: hypothetical protein AAF628_32480 [Planctomycetota bacterium]
MTRSNRKAPRRQRHGAVDGAVTLYLSLAILSAPAAIAGSPAGASFCCTFAITLAALRRHHRFALRLGALATTAASVNILRLSITPRPGQTLSDRGLEHWLLTAAFALLMLLATWWSWRLLARAESS